MTICNRSLRAPHVFLSEEAAFHAELTGLMIKPIRNIMHEFFYGKVPEFPLNEVRVLNKTQLEARGLNGRNYSLHPDYPNSRFQIVQCCSKLNCASFFVIRRLNTDYPQLKFDKKVVLREDELAKLFLVVRDGKMFSLVREYSDSYFNSYILADERTLLTRRKMKLKE